MKAKAAKRLTKRRRLRDLSMFSRRKRAEATTVRLPEAPASVPFLWDGPAMRVCARQRSTGSDFVLQEIRPYEMAHYRDTTRGRPMYWCGDGYGGITVYPEPTDDYEIVRPADFRPWLYGIDLARSGLDATVIAAIHQRADAEIARQLSQSMYRPEDLYNNTLTHRAVESLTTARIAEYIAQAGMALNRDVVRDLLLPGLTATRMEFGAGMTRLGAALAGVTHFPRFPHVDAETAQCSRERARGLLKSLLTAEQWAEFEAGNKVTERIEGCEFTLRPGGAMIEARKPRLVGTVKERWCISPDPYADGNDWMPAEDQLIGQLLHLRAGPDKLRAAANVFPG